MSSETTNHDEAIGRFCGVTGADEERARSLLEACDWNLELAVNMHVDTDDGGRKTTTTASNNHQSSLAGPSTASTSDSVPVVTIPEDLNEDQDSDRTNGITHPTDHDHSRQPERHWARRGRQNASSTSNSSFPATDDVRPPIPPVRQVLVSNPAGFSSDMPQRRYNTRSGHTSDVYDAFRDFQAEARWQELAQEAESSGAADGIASNLSKPGTLEDLFRPPLEIMFRGPFTSAREVGSQQNKWLLVNIQNGREFACQTLNRDVWSNQAVKDIMKEHFIFWQVYHDSYEGSRYLQFYNATSLPHVAIIDPRTGEQMKAWPTSIDHNSFCDSVIEFLADHPNPDGSIEESSMKKLRVKEEDATVVASQNKTLYDQSEEAQLEAAIQASLRDTEKSNSQQQSRPQLLELDSDDELPEQPHEQPPHEPEQSRQQQHMEEEQQQHSEEPKQLENQEEKEARLQEERRARCLAAALARTAARSTER